ncbi:MAG: response regulator [Ilumatobacteraceae bacterium]
MSEPDGTAHAAPRVCIIDDHEMLADALATALDLSGVGVVGRAGSVADGVAMVERLRPDVLVCDFHLPDGDALAIIARVMSTRPATRIVVLTGANDAATAVSALSIGAVGYLTKDQPLRDLVDAIRSAAAGATVIAPRLTDDVMSRLLRPRAQIGADLTPREREALQLMAAGQNAPAIAATMSVSHNTARKYVQGVLDKLRAHTQLEAVAIARREGLVRELDRHRS